MKGVVTCEGGGFFEVLGRGVDGDCLACNWKRWRMLYLLGKKRLGMKWGIVFDQV